MVRSGSTGDGGGAAARIAVAQAYLHALLSHDPREVTFAPGATRYEAGLKTGFSGAHLTRSLRRGPQYRLLRGLGEVAWSFDGDDVLADYRLEVGAARRGLFSIAIAERFTVPADDLRIHRIDVAFTPWGRRRLLAPRAS